MAFPAQGTRPVRPAPGRSETAAQWPCIIKRTAVVLLLLAVPLLSTLAKDSWYLPQANTAHYLNGAIKMKVSHAKLLVRWEPPMPTMKLVPPPMPREVLARIGAERLDPLVPDIGVTLSLQHRSPPSYLL